MGKKEKKPLFKRPITWIVLVIILIIIAVPKGGSDNNTNSNTPADTTSEVKEEPKKLSLQETYDKLKNGMSKKEVEDIIGKDAGTCSVTEAEYVGKVEACTYGDAVNNVFDGGIITVNYTNDKLDMKTIGKF